MTVWDAEREENRNAVACKQLRSIAQVLARRKRAGLPKDHNLERLAVGMTFDLLDRDKLPPDVAKEISGSILQQARRDLAQIRLETVRLRRVAGKTPRAVRQRVRLVARSARAPRRARTAATTRTATASRDGPPSPDEPPRCAGDAPSTPRRAP